MKNVIKNTAFLLSVFCLSLITGVFIFAWTEPSQAPPGDNVDVPINVGTSHQVKQGNLSVTALYDTNDSNYYVNPNIQSVLNGPLYVEGTPDGEVAAMIKNIRNHPGAVLTKAALYIENNALSSGATDAQYAKIWIDAYKNNAGGDFYVDNVGKGKDMYFRTTDSGGVTDAGVTILSDGKVGIGTTGPGAKLDIQAASASPELIITRDTSGVIKSRLGYIDTSGTGGGNIFLYNAAGTLTSFIGGGTGGAYINSGNVGIGTASPSAKLHVAGNIIASNPTAPEHVATKGYVDTQVSQRGCYVSYLGSSGSCLSGFTNMGSAGAWGSCKHPTTGNYDSYFLPAGGSCTSGYTFTQLGTASVCCK